MSIWNSEQGGSTTIDATAITTALGYAPAPAMATATITTLPGHGIVPDVIVANYTALDAYSGDNVWIEVTSGENGTVEIFRKDGALHGPFGAWIKNAKYTFGQNGEDILVIPDSLDRTSMRSSAEYARFIGVSGTGYNSTVGYQILRTSKCLPIYVSTTGGIIRNEASIDSSWVAVINLDGVNSNNNGLLEALFGGEGNWAPTYMLPGRGSSVTITVQDDNSLRADTGSLPGLAGVPVRGMSSRVDYGHYLGTYASSFTGVVEIDYQSIDLIGQSNTATVTYTPSGTTTVAYQKNTIYKSTAATGGTSWAVTGLASTSTWYLELTNGGSQTQTWFTGTTWDGGTAPTLTAAGVDVLGFYTTDGGTTIRGFLLAKDIK